MKTLKAILGILAFVGAIGGAFATQYHNSVSIPAYRFVDGTIDACLQVTDHDCIAPNGQMCEVNGDNLKESSEVEAQCGRFLGRD